MSLKRGPKHESKPARGAWAEHESPTLGTCVSGKLRYASRTQAKRASKARQRGVRSGQLRGEQSALYPYECPSCGAWHLTKQPQS